MDYQPNSLNFQLARLSFGEKPINYHFLSILNPKFNML